MNTLRTGAELDGERFDGVDLSGVRAADASLIDCVLDGCSLDGARLDGVRVIDSTVRQASGASVRFVGSMWRDAAFETSRLGVVDLADAELTRVSFVDCKIDVLNLRGSRLRDVTLHRVRVGELDLGEASGRSVLLDDCTVGVLDLHHAQLESLDVSTSELRDEVRGLDGLRGVILSAQQAHDLAGAMGAHLGARIAEAGVARS